MLLHNPDAKDSVKNNKWDLSTGHTHGGHDPVHRVTVGAGERHERGQGLFTYEAKPLYITPGVGSSQRRLRLGCRPEVSVLEVAL